MKTILNLEYKSVKRFIRKIKKFRQKLIVKCLHLNLIADVAQFTKSNKGRPMLVDPEGFYYYRHFASQSNPSKVFWRCQNKDRKDNQCSARATTDGFLIIKYLHVHNHTAPCEGFPERFP